MHNAFSYSAFGSSGGSGLPLTGGTLTGALVVNTASGFTGRIIDAQVNGSTKGHITHDGRLVLSGDTFNNFSTPIVQIAPGRGLCSTGASVVNVAVNSTDCLAISPSHLTVGSGMQIGFGSAATPGANSPDAFFTRAAAASIQLGANHATTATNQTIKAHNVTTGTGADLCLKGGTGSVANGVVSFGVRSAIGAETITGFITIKDEGGTVRKLAVVS